MEKDVAFEYKITLNLNSKKIYRWILGGSTFRSKYDEPTLLTSLTNTTTYNSTTTLSLDLPRRNEWIYIVLQSSLALPHPIHLHGHDFYILAQGPGTYTANSPLNFKNPPRRDTALMPGAGYLVIAFVTDNLGVWLLHCHVGWHSSMGFALQILEMRGEIEGTLEGVEGMRDVCEGWRRYERVGREELDSGI